MKQFLLTLLAAICFVQLANAQIIATKSYPFAVGTTSACGGSTARINFYNYDGSTNTIQSATGGLVAPCTPQLRIGTPLNGTQKFTSNLASVSLNPKDHKIYYLWTTYSPSARTYAWSWPVGTCPGTVANKLDTIRSYAADLLGVAFDNNGNAYVLEFTTVPIAGQYKMMLRSINFTTGALGAADTLALTGGAKIYTAGAGDVAMSPSGQMFFVSDNKLFTPNYTAYTGTGANLTCTYIDTVKLTGNFVGLTYAEGETIAAFSGGGCPFYEINPLTAITTNVTKSGTVASTSDFGTIVSGIGAAKKLISVTPTGTANQYNVVYDIVVKNYGNMDVNNVQVLDTLANINGAANVSNVSVTIPVNPNGYTVNPLYTGVGPLATNYNLLSGTNTLPNYPLANNSFTIRITCRLSNIISGVIYYNRAAATATDFNSNALKDMSMNGNNNNNNPDPSANDKPDDFGEDEPTPLLISVTPTGSPCISLTKVLFTQDFGSILGTGLSTTIPAPVVGSGASGGAGTTSYTGSTTVPLPVERYAITNNAKNANTTRFVNLTDHTGGANGAMLVVNADAASTKLYRGSFNYTMCPNQQYSVSFYSAFLGNSNYKTVCDGVGGFKYPKLQINVLDGTTLTTIATLITGDITDSAWQQFGLKFTSPGTYTSIVLELVNAGPGGCGNDLGIDDIQFGSCDPIPVVNAGYIAGCIGSSSTFTGALTDPTALPGTKEYQWQVATALAGPYTDIVGATSNSYTINPVNASDTGKYYRLAVAASGNMVTPGCRFYSNGLVLAGFAPSTGPASITASTAIICSGSSTTLTANGATLGTSANYQWGTGSTVGASAIAGATNSTLVVSPTTTTTYWVRVENTASPCSATTGGVTTTVTVNQPSVAPSSISGADVCNGGSTTLTAVGATLGTSANYQWGTGSIVGTSPIVGATSSTLTVSPTVNTTYWVRIQNTAGPCSATTSGQTKIITVNQPSVAPSSITGADICKGSSTTLTAVGATLGTSANYQWGTGATVGTSPIVGATSSTLTVSPTTTTTYWVRVENTLSPCTATTGGLTKTITVSQPSAAPSSITGADICNGSSTTLTAFGATLGTSANYQWGTGAVVGTSPIVGATGSTLTVSPTTTTTYWVRVENTSSPCTATTSGLTKTITVSQPSVAPSSITGADICNGSSTTLTAVGATLGTSANYQWGTGGTPGTSPIVGATGSTLTVSPTTTTTYWVRVENTLSPCTANTGGLTKTITVSQPSVAPSSITGADICNGSSTTLTAVGATLGTSANYQWGTGAVIGTSPIGGATSSTLTVSPTTTTTYWVRIENTSSPCTATTGGLTKTITVSQPSIAPSSVTGADICNPGSTTLTAVGATLGTSANYQWGTGATVGTSPIVGATSSTLTVSPTTTTTYWVRVENNAGPCAATTSGLTKTITVSQPSIAPASITGADICNGSSTTLTAVGATLGSSANYQWGTGAVVGTSPIVGATGSTLTVSPTTTTTYWVRVENTLSPCTSTTGGVTKIITVRQPSVAPSSITGADICNPGSTTLTAVGATLGTSANYQWGTGAVVGTSPIVGATSSTLTVSPATTTTYWVRVENTLSPCTSTTGGLTKTITVNQPSIAPTSITGADICNGASTTLTAVGATLGSSANYQWGTGAVVGTSPIVGATGSTLTVSPTVTTTYWVRVENTGSPCTANTAGKIKVITVSQLSVAATAATKNKNNICPGISVSLGITGGTLGTAASWKWYTGAGCGTTLAGSGATLTVTPAVTTTYYVRAEGSCNTTSCQSVTVFISCNIDKDKDGIPDWVESNMAAAFADANGNGIINAYDPTYAGFVDNNNDFINDNFQADGDSDNDGIPNYLDTDFPGRIDTNGDGVDDRFDTDKDGIINMLDLDSDNDGIPDVVEAYGVDTNGDGKLDNFIDADGDGLSDRVDGNLASAYNSGLGLNKPDFDNDGVPNYLDLDSDNDGIPDVVETGGPDSNNDGKIDGFVDANGDGLHDGYINGTALLITGADTNNDGRADSWPNKNMDRDLRPNAYDLDSDGDGIVDVIEAGLPDADLNGIVDGVIGANGWSTSVSGLAALNLRNTDFDGKPDYLDIDADDDGIPDNIEGQSTANYKLPSLTDSDGDGLVNTYDNIVGFGGGGIFVYDHDGDGTPDYRDLDSDADGLADIVEGNDFNLNKIADDNVTLTGIDTDGDGLDNRFDSLNSVTNLKGTSYMMGNLGSFSGDAAPGTRSPVQRSYTYQTDRDWRYSSYVLPVQFLNLNANLQTADKVLLNWTIVSDKDIDHFEIERSTDNINFIRTGSLLQTVLPNVTKQLAYTDNVAGINAEVIYYRIKVIGKNGQIQFSNIVFVKRKNNDTEFKVMPNPAKDYVSILLFSQSETTVTLRLIDDIGQLLLVEKRKVFKGTNTMQILQLNRFSNGVYTLQVYIDEKVLATKLILIK